MSEGRVSALSKRRFEEGSGPFKSFLSLAFIAAVIFVAVKTIPPYMDNYQLQDHIQQLSVHVAVRTAPITADEVRNEVVGFAKDHGIPVTADDVKVTVSNHVSISLDYNVPVDLKVYTLMLHFTPSAENRTL
jgi:cell division protein FtsL